MSDLKENAQTSGTYTLIPLGYLLRQASAAHRLKMERALADLNITPSQLLILTMLSKQPGSSNADLSRMASLTTPTVTVIVKNLKRQGALSSRPHAVHGRVQHLDLTELGIKLLADCRERATKVEAELQASMSASDIQQISTWLRQVAMGDAGIKLSVTDTPA